MESPKIYKIVSHPDTVIVLTRPLVSFAVWPESIRRGQEPHPRKGNKAAPGPTPVITGEAPQSSIFGDGGVSSSSALPATTASDPAPTTSFENADTVSIHRDGTIENPPSALDATPDLSKILEGSVHYHVSSRHLIEASSYFSNMLSGEKWQEGVRKDDGRFYVAANDADERALEILLNVLHLKNRHVPDKLHPEMLTKVAVLVDYYECIEAVKAYGLLWCLHLTIDPANRPSIICRELILWICIAYVFRSAALFKQLTTVALTESKIRLLPSLGLPIYHILDDISKERFRYFETSRARVDAERDKLFNPLYICKHGEKHSFACSSLLYGALIRQLVKAGMMGLEIRKGFKLSIGHIRTKVADFKTPKWRVDGIAEHKCNLDDFKKFFQEPPRVPELSDYVKSGEWAQEL